MVSDLLPFNSRSFSRNHRCTAFEHSVIRLREVSVYGNEELGVICELMVADIERLDDASDWCYIGGEQRRPQSLVTRLRCKKMRQTIAWKLRQLKSFIDTRHWIYCIYIFQNFRNCLLKSSEISGMTKPRKFRNFGIPELPRLLKFDLQTIPGTFIPVQENSMLLWRKKIIR